MEVSEVFSVYTHIITHEYVELVILVRTQFVDCLSYPTYLHHILFTLLLPHALCEGLHVSV